MNEYTETKMLELLQGIQKELQGLRREFNSFRIQVMASLAAIHGEPGMPFCATIFPQDLDHALEHQEFQDSLRKRIFAANPGKPLEMQKMFSKSTFLNFQDPKKVGTFLKSPEGQGMLQSFVVPSNE